MAQLFFFAALAGLISMRRAIDNVSYEVASTPASESSNRYVGLSPSLINIIAVSRYVIRSCVVRNMAPC